MSIDPPRLKEALQTFHQELERRFHQGVSVVNLLHARARFIDTLICACWRHHLGAYTRQAALVAVGGYGRRELHPHSDIDLLVLVPEFDQPQLEHNLGTLFTLLWDIGLKPGHSVRTVSQCVEAAAQDQTVITNLMDARLIDGDPILLQAMNKGIDPSRIWPSHAFFQAKQREQETRYAKCHDTAYNLEPNIKEGPGGLRDIQTIGWVIKRHSNATTLQELVARGALTEAEYAELQQDLYYLWRVRFALHLLAGRCEDRLLFDFQRTLAQWFGFQGEGNQPVEAFMQSYFRTAQSVQRLNEMLLQLLEEKLSPEFNSEPEILDQHFQITNDHLEIRHEDVFIQHPLGLLEIFLYLQLKPQLKGIRANTIRVIRQNLHLIDDNFRLDPNACRLFLQIFRQPEGITHQLRRMNRYGVLAAYLPEFGKIVGRMQYDLFHAYTVDEHSLFVVRNLRRMSLPRFREELPFAANVFPLIARPEVLYLTGLYHDIGKGQGGDHSAVGEQLARDFCQRHGMEERDTGLICWLVRNHLLMSVTAQRKDIQDPEVIQAFASQVADEDRLNHLYLLTVADIRGTNPTLWNSWRDTLLKELFLSTRKVLRQQMARTASEDRVADTKRDAWHRLERLGLDEKTILGIWSHFDDSYFLRCQPDECVWHTIAIAVTPETQLPLVLVRPQDHRGSAEIFIYMRDRDGIFSQIAAHLDLLGLTILAAKLGTSLDGYVVNSFHVLERDGSPVAELPREQQIATRLKRCLKDPSPPCFKIERRAGRHLKHFSLPVEIRFHPDPQRRYSVMELVAADRPGLLAIVGKIFDQFGIRLHEARIATLGNRAEDVFCLSDQNNQPLSDEELRRSLADSLQQSLA